MNPQGPNDPSQPPYNNYPGPAPQPYGYQPGGPGGPGGSYPVEVKGTMILILGILSLVCCGIVCGPIAWVMGNNAMQAIDSGQADPAQRSNASIGRILGMIGTALGIIGIIYYSFFGSRMMHHV